MGSLYDKFKKSISKLEMDEGKGEKDINKQGDKGGGQKKNDKGGLVNNLLIIFLIGVLLVIVGSIFKPSGKSTNSKNATAVGAEQNETQIASDEDSSAVSLEYKDKMQQELVDTLEKIEGVGKVHAMIYFSSGTEQVPVFNEDSSTSTTNEEDNSGGHRSIVQENGNSNVVMENDGQGQKPFVTKTNNPKITGVCIVAEGADNNVTELRIRQAVTGLFGLQDINVQVYPMAK